MEAAAARFESCRNCFVNEKTIVGITVALLIIMIPLSGLVSTNSSCLGVKIARNVVMGATICLVIAVALQKFSACNKVFFNNRFF